MSESVVYKLSKEAISIVDDKIDMMDQWLMQMSDEELSKWHIICDKVHDQRTEEEIDIIDKYAIVLYYRELDVEELSINSELIADITSRFCVNIIVASLRRRRGIVKTEEPLLLYKSTKMELTEKGKKINEENK